MSDESSGNWLYKIVGGLFATIVAPLLVALGVKLLDNPAPAPAQPGGAAPANEGRPVGPAAQGGTNEKKAAPQALTADDKPTRKSVPPRQPTHTLRLFNGQDLTGFYTYLGPARPKTKPLGKNHDPRNVFTVHDGLIHVTGELLGGLVTEQEFKNYRLTVVYKWGNETWPPRKDNARASGVLLHGTGPDDQVGRHAQRAIRCLIGEGETGGLMLLGSTPKEPIGLEAAAERVDAPGDGRKVQHFQYRPEAPPMTITHGYLVRLDRPPGWRDVKGFHGRRDVEHAAGEWNTLVCTCRGPKISIRLNGKLVNEVIHSSLHKGKITLQSVHAEIFFRRVDLEQFAADAAEPQS